jgi:hypothetical protein
LVRKVSVCQGEWSFFLSFIWRPLALISIHIANSHRIFLHPRFLHHFVVFIDRCRSDS